MPTTTTTTRMTPRWKAIFDQLCQELSAYNYGSRFHTISDICQKFEVSTTTAIRVLNELSNAGLVEKIPNKGNVVRQVNQKAAVHLLVPADAHADFMMYEPIMRRITQGLRVEAEHRGIEFHSLSERFLTNFSLQRDVPYGFLLPAQIHRRTVKYLRQHDVPHIFVNQNRPLKRSANVYVDWEKSGYIAAQHLLELGHRRIAFVAGRIELRHARDRVRGYRNALREAGVAFRWALVKQVVDPDGGRDEVMRRFRELMQLPARPTAVIAATDYSAIYMLEACKELGLSVPGDVSIVGYPNHPESGMTQPALTVIDAHYEEIAQGAVALLLEQIFSDADPARQNRCIAPELIVRGSTSPEPPHSSSLES